jgi:hypothetical protein
MTESTQPGSKAGQTQADRAQSELVPASMTAKEFGKVYVRKEGAEMHVEFTVWMPELEGAQAEGWQTGLALDGSASMKNWYGRNLTGVVPQAEVDEYRRQGWLTSRVEDGCKVTSFSRAAYEDAIKKGHLKFTENIVQPLARDCTAYLAGQLDSDGGTTVIYWACGDGSAFEVLGDFTETQCQTLEVRGPQKVSFGEGTKLTPAVKYFVDRFADSPRGIYVFITDGRLDDLKQLMQYTTQLAREIEGGQRNPVKCVLIGVGNSIDEKQLEELDDLDTGTDVDIWDQKIAKEMRDISEIIVELVDEHKMVTDSPATILDAAGQVVARFSDGLPARVTFTMPASSPHFELEVAGRVIRQAVVNPGR